jgi:hypothetical protein
VVLFNHQYRRRTLVSHFPSLYLQLSLCMWLGDVGEGGEDHCCEELMYQIKITDRLSSMSEMRCDPLFMVILTSALGSLLTTP